MLRLRSREVLPFSVVPTAAAATRMTRYSFVLLLLKILLLSSSVLFNIDVVDADVKNGDKRVGFKKNVNIARQWTCKNPQPRLVYISK